MPAKRRRIMRQFTINELSAVDVPAQEGARRTLMKRYDYEEKDEMDDMEKISRFDTLEEAVDAIQLAQKLARHEAMSEAARRYPKLLNKHNSVDATVVKDRNLGVPTHERKLGFEDGVRKIMTRDNVTHTKAMSAARVEYPLEFAAAFGS